MSFNWHKAMKTARQETAAHLENTRRMERLGDNQLMGRDTSKKKGLISNQQRNTQLKPWQRQRRYLCFGQSPSATSRRSLSSHIRRYIFFWNRVLSQPVNFHRPQAGGAFEGVSSAVHSCSIAPDCPERPQTHRRQWQEQQAQTEASRQKVHLRRHTSQSKTQ